jgi:hypothetical protein
MPIPRAVLLSLMAVVSPHAAAMGQDTQDGQVWAQALVTGPVSESWRVHLEVQPRIFDNASELGLTIVRGAIGRQIAPRVAAFIGYGWVPRSLGPTTRHERRIWQQLSLVLPAGGAWTTSGRIRLEQRSLDPWLGRSHRLRLLARAQRTLEGPWTLAMYNEAMVTLDHTPLGPARGYDRNRLYGGLMRRLTPTFTAELGYIWENSTIAGPPQRNDHIAIGVMNIVLPRR